MRKFILSEISKIYSYLDSFLIKNTKLLKNYLCINIVYLYKILNELFFNFFSFSNQEIYKNSLEDWLNIFFYSIKYIYWEFKIIKFIVYFFIFLFFLNFFNSFFFFNYNYPICFNLINYF